MDDAAKQQHATKKVGFGTQRNDAEDALPVFWACIAKLNPNCLSDPETLDRAKLLAPTRSMLTETNFLNKLVTIRKHLIR
jgi:hypothetical protein